MTSTFPGQKSCPCWEQIGLGTVDDYTCKENANPNGVIIIMDTESSVLYMYEFSNYTSTHNV